MIVAFAMSLAYWVWVFFKPSTIADIPPSAPATQTILPSILAGHWFSTSNSSNEIAPVIAPAPSMKLVGLFSSTPKRPGFAIFQLENGKQQYAVVNHEIVAGVTLVGVNRKSVTVMQNGETSEIKLVGSVDTEKPSQPKAVINTVTPSAPSGAPTSAPPANEEAKPFNIQELIQKSNLGGR
jgi:type II secretory pathway component PulC